MVEGGSEVIYTTRTTCRVCDSSDLVPLFSLGTQAVSDFVPADKIHAGQQCPIELELCSCCTLVQARHTAEQEFLYRRFYWFKSGCTQTLRDALTEAALTAQQRANLQPGDVVLDIGSNDSTMLRAYTTPGIIRVGCEPATNLAAEARQGIDCLIREFWSYLEYSLALYLDKRTTRWERLPKAKIITAFGMLYDSEYPNAFIGDVAKALAPDGLFVAQLMCLKQTIDKGDVGNFAHEHLLFFSLRSLEYLLGKHGLEIFDVEENDVNGGSYRLYCGHKGNKTLWTPKGFSRKCWAIQSEKDMRLGDPDTYAAFFPRMQANRNACVSYLREQRAAGKRIWILGASTKGNVIAQWYGFDAGLIEAAAERSPEKVGLHMVGTGIPIRSEAEFRAAKPDIAVILPYSFAPEIMERERAFREAGGVFCVPLPSFKVVWPQEGT